MDINPFSSDYVGDPAKQTNNLKDMSDVVSVHRNVESRVGEDLVPGFKINPIPMASGKPKRVIIKGKVTRD